MMDCTKTYILSLILLLLSTHAVAGNLDDIRAALEEGSAQQVQEKVYLHVDNSCYFVGDTLWFKGYVVRADNLQPTDMSRILYVELLSPDGLLVERQNIIISPNGHTCGQFILEDSLYSGYYELRAYTRWMLNFNMRYHRYSRHDTWVFYNKQMAADYYRIWDGLYSRVLPIYSKPEEAGDYDARYMYQRPKQRLPQKRKDNLIVTFYPEGGHLIEGVENRVAFDIVDQYGEAIDIKGTLNNGLQLKTDYMGRGSILMKPTENRMKASFKFRGKDYSISLPKSEKNGVALALNDGRLTLNARQLPAGHDIGLSVLCRGALKHFQQVSFDGNGHAEIQLPIDSLPTGVNEVTVFTDEGQILASRLFFVNHHEQDDNLITAPIETTRTYQPYEKIDLPVKLNLSNRNSLSEQNPLSNPTTFSIAIRDASTDEPSYNDGNVMTDLLLSSELRGFIAHPAYYFEADDETHRHNLDLLMMVQGWRKYRWQELNDTSRTFRYTPETTMTVEGAVYKMLGLNEVEPEEITSWQNGVGAIGRKSDQSDDDNTDPWAAETEDSGLTSTDDITLSDNDSDNSGLEYGQIGSANDMLGVNHSNLKSDVLIEAEIAVGKQFAGSVQKTQNGRFVFAIPPFYGMGYLNMKAYKENDSIKKNMASRKDAKVYNEDSYPDFYVKRDLFYPIFTHEYNYYERHQPDIFEDLFVDTLSELSMENDVHQLQNVNVKGHRRGRRAIDWKKPAFVLDAYDTYNEITDRGLSFGKLDMRQFPVQVARYLYGNMNRYNTFHVDGRIDNAVYYRNYSPVSSDAGEAELAGVFRANRTPQSIYKNLKLKRLKDIRVFSDYEPRIEDSLMIEERYSADVTVELVTMDDDAVRPTYRDRHIVLQGFNEPWDFYNPDYSNQQPTEPTDYRRTLYWNPNAVADENGEFHAVFYNNAKQTRIRMSAAGVTPDGQLMHSK